MCKCTPSLTLLACSLPLYVSKTSNDYEGTLAVKVGQSSNIPKVCVGVLEQGTLYTSLTSHLTYLTLPT